MTFMHQNLDLTLPDSSLNMELYYKDHLYLIENGNIKLSKLIIETAHLVSRFTCNTKVIVDASSNPPASHVKIAVTKT